MDKGNNIMKIDGPIKHILILDLIDGKPHRKTVSLRTENMLLKLQNELLRLFLDSESVSVDLVVVSNSKTILIYVHRMFEKICGDRFNISPHSIEFSGTYYHEFENGSSNEQALLSLAYEKLPSIIENIVSKNYNATLEVPLHSCLNEFPIWYCGIEYLQGVDERQSWQEYFDCGSFERMIPHTQKPKVNTWFHLISHVFDQFDCDNWLERNTFAMKVAQFVAVFHLLEAASGNDWNNIDGEELLTLPFDSLWLGIMASDFDISLEEFGESSDAEAAIVERLAIQSVSEAIGELRDIFSGPSPLLFVLWASIYPNYGDTSSEKFLRVTEGLSENHELEQIWHLIDSGNIETH